MDFDKKEYIKNKSWEHSSGLLNGETAVKQCQLCEKRKYSVEFLDVPEYVDGKIPVCTSCFKKAAKKTAVYVIIQEDLKVRICRKCERERPLEMFLEIGKDNDLTAVCQSCRSSVEKKLEDTESP